MRSRQWDCISTLTGLLFVGFVTIKLISTSWFWENIAYFLVGGVLVFILYSILKNDDRGEGAHSPYPKTETKLNVEIENLPLKVEQEEIVFDLENSEYKNRLAKFKNFLGFSNLDSKKSVIKKLGNPTKDETSKQNEFNSLNYKDILSFDYNKKTNLITSIEIFATRDLNESIKYLKGLDLDDQYLDFIGKEKNEILKFFGKPTRDSGSFIYYEFKKFEVQFFCLHSKRCSIIRVDYD